MENARFKFFSSYGRIITVFFLGLVVFFFAAFIVVSLSTRSTGRYQVPNLVDQYYVDVHNKLADNLRIKLDKVHSPDKPRGIILQQDIPPGKFVAKKKTEIHLVVNQGVHQVPVPDLVNKTLDFARKAIRTIPVDDRTIRLSAGAITYIGDPSEIPGQKPDPNVDPEKMKEMQENNIVLQQWPPAKAMVPLNQKIYLLVAGNPSTVAGGKTGKKKNNDKYLADLSGMQYHFARLYLQKFAPQAKISVKLTQVHKAGNYLPRRHLSGTINGQSVEAGGELANLKDLELSVAWFPDKFRYTWGIDRLDWKPTAAGEHTIRLIHPEKGIYFTERRQATAGTPLTLLLPRDDSSQLQITRQGKMALESNLSPHEF